MTIAILKYNAGNVRSVAKALERLGYEWVWTDKESELRAADKIIFPGQGEASSSMRYLQEQGLDKLIPTLEQPFLGICLGLQLLGTHSEENDTDCLQVLDMPVKRFRGNELKVPHMGWNQIHNLQDQLFTGIQEKSYVYFVHSYYGQVTSHTTAITEYGNSFSAAAVKDNFYAVQFHPEKSGSVGEQILQNFLEL